MRFYGIVSILVAILLCVPFILRFERSKKSSKELAIIAVMTAAATVSRLIFFATPGFKPIGAMVIIAGIYLGASSGFMVGAMSALISNFFFGQGPWTPFQMLAFGLVGFFAGLCGNLGKIKRDRLVIPSAFNVIFGVIAGILYSCLVDIWTVLAFADGFNFGLYWGALIAAFPFTVQYCLSNVIFLIILNRMIGEKLERLKLKYGVFEAS